MNKMRFKFLARLAMHFGIATGEVKFLLYYAVKIFIYFTYSSEVFINIYKDVFYSGGWTWGKCPWGWKLFLQSHGSRSLLMKYLELNLRRVLGAGVSQKSPSGFKILK